MAIIRTDPPMGEAGPTLEEARILAPWLVEAGIAAFHVSLADHGAIGDTIPAMGTQPYGCFLDLAETVKSAVDVPVTAVGRILRPELAEQVLQAGRADLVAIGRGLIAEPDWPRKVQLGQRDGLRLCIMCNHCAGSLMTGQPLACAINAEVGEGESAGLRPAVTPRKVLVGGGGPAGMEAARVAGLRGHHVTLAERESQLGGQLRICAAPPFKAEINLLTEYLAGELQRLSIDIRTGTTLTADALNELQPDAVILATGARPAPLPVPAGDNPNVVTAWAVLEGDADVGRQVVIVGGGAVGVETALFLAAAGRHITVVELLDRIGGQESPTIMPFITRRIREEGIRILTGHRLIGIRGDGVIVEPAGQPPVFIACDTVVNAVGTMQNAALKEEIERRHIECHLAGDCSATSRGTIADAIREDYRAGLQV